MESSTAAAAVATEHKKSQDRTAAAGLVMSIPRVRAEVRACGSFTSGADAPQLEAGHFSPCIDAHSATVLAAAMQVFVEEIAVASIVAAVEAKKKTVSAEHVAQGVSSNGGLEDVSRYITVLLTQNSWSRATSSSRPTRRARRRRARRCRRARSASASARTTAASAPTTAACSSTCSPTS